MEKGPSWQPASRKWLFIRLPITKLGAG